MIREEEGKVRLLGSHQGTLGCILHFAWHPQRLSAQPQDFSKNPREFPESIWGLDNYGRAWSWMQGYLQVGVSNKQ